MTRHITSRPNADLEAARETRTPVRLPAQTTSTLFQGWGPKF
jgi:hypothetical protein